MSIAAASSGRNDFRLISRRPALGRVDIIKNLGVLCGSPSTAKLHVKLGRVGHTRAQHTAAERSRCTYALIYRAAGRTAKPQREFAVGR